MTEKERESEVESWSRGGGRSVCNACKVGHRVYIDR